MATMAPMEKPKFLFARRIVQTLSIFALNPVFFQLKGLCVPVMNCWSCPAAAYACPIGAIGYYLAAGFIPFLALGIMIATGILVGRLLCGWVCPFGFIQELLHKIPTKKFEPPKFTYLFKYFILVFFVFMVASFWRSTEVKAYFCSWCPAGMLEAAVPVKTYEALGGDITTHPGEENEPQAEGTEVKRPTVMTFLKSIKFWILIAVLLGAVFMNRFFCRVICPIGAMLGIFNKISFLNLKIGRGKCEGCSSCAQKCTMDPDLKPAENSPECIRCYDCLPTTCEVDYDVELRQAWCKGCGLCAEFCPEDVFSQDELKNITVSHPERCIGCGWCTKLCPDFGITVKAKKDIVKEEETRRFSKDKIESEKNG